MIAPTELRIGNYVEVENYKIIQLDNVHKKGTTKGDEQYLISMLKPIELTEDWLVRMGFKRETKDDKYGRVWQHKDFGNFFLRRVNYNKPFDKADFGFALEISDESNWVTIFKRVQCVHQLQNLFHSLTGEELTVTRNEM